MPVHEYMCRGCGTRNEFLEGVTLVTEDKICEECGSTDLHKLISLSSFTVTSGGVCESGDCACAQQQGGAAGACGCGGTCGHL